MMTREDVFAKLKEILTAEFELTEEAVTLQAKLTADLDLDSIDAVDLIVKMKPYLSGKLEPEQFKNVKTVQDVVDVLYPLVQNR
jgi:acyl carrier protein